MSNIVSVCSAISSEGHGRWALIYRRDQIRQGLLFLRKATAYFVKDAKWGMRLSRCIACSSAFVPCAGCSTFTRAGFMLSSGGLSVSGLLKTGDRLSCSRKRGRTAARSTRIYSEAAFAKLCGVCPIPASSGKTHRFRLNRGGNRQANAARYRVAIVRRRCHEPTLAY